jgi:hypothetical protein
MQKSRSRDAIRAREARAATKKLGYQTRAARSALNAVSSDELLVSQTPFSDNAAQAAQSYREGEQILNDAFAAEIFNDFQARLAEKLAEGRSGWWNPMLCSLDKLRFMAVAALERRDYQDAAVLCAMVAVRLKA